MPSARLAELWETQPAEPRTFEFIDIADWCRAAADVHDFATNQRTWLPLFEPATVDSWVFSRKGTDPLGNVGSGSSVPSAARTAGVRDALSWKRIRWQSGRSALDDFLARVSLNLGQSARDLMSGGARNSGSKVANLGPAYVVSSSLLVLVRSNLAITEGYGDARWARYQRMRWPKAHYFPASVVGIDRRAWHRMRIKAFRIDDAEPLTVNKPCVYLTVRQDDRNPYHWLLETLPRLKCLDAVPELRKLPLLMSYPPTTFQRAFLDWMGVKNEILVSNGRNVRCSDLIFPSIPAPPMLHPGAVAWLKEKILAGHPQVPDQSRRRILISRRDSTNGRRVTNEDELAGKLAMFGFERLTLAQMPPAEQVRAFRQAEIVVLPHGAAGTHLLFAPRDCCIVELQPSREPNSLFFVLSRMLELRYSVLFGQARNRRNDYYVDLDQLAALIRDLDATLAAARTPLARA